MAYRAGRLRSDIWNKYGSLQAWGIPHQKLYKEFQKTNPPQKYQLDQKQWQKTFERVINDIHATIEAAKTIVIRKIYRFFKPEKDGDGKEIKDSSFRLDKGYTEAFTDKDGIVYIVMRRVISKPD